MVRRAGDLVNYFVITSISLSLGFVNGASYAVAAPGASLPAAAWYFRFYCISSFARYERK
jgi:hypothetical protein